MPARPPNGFLHHLPKTLKNHGIEDVHFLFFSVPDLVESHGNNDDSAYDNLLDVIGPTHHIGAVPQEGHNKDSNHGPKDTS